MARYKSLLPIKTKDNNIRNKGLEYKPLTKYPLVPFNANDIYVATEFGDRLDLLANQFYNDTSLYWIILAANPQSFKDGSLIPPVGTTLRIPINILEIQASYEGLNVQTKDLDFIDENNVNEIDTTTQTTGGTSGGGGGGGY